MSRVSLLTAYWEATNLLSSHPWVQEVFIPHNAFNKYKTESWWKHFWSTYSIYSFHVIARWIKNILFILQPRSKSCFSSAKISDQKAATVKDAITKNILTLHRLLNLHHRNGLLITAMKQNLSCNTFAKSYEVLKTSQSIMKSRG